jgi:3-deoxy-7-phosphoheptulonate synthase
MIAGPCSVETEAQMNAAADAVAAGGASMMRGGAFKPRTSPYAFQGTGVDGLKLLKDAAARHGLPVVTELMDVRMLDTFLAQEVDVIQIGTRNMQNFDLLKEVGRVDVPVILKRGMSATISEWLMAAEYIAAGGNHRIILCERGIRTFETAYRNVLDVTAIAVLKRETHLPVIADPSHAGGKAWMVSALSCAAVAAGADGLLVEVHPNPPEAWCDADQALTPAEFAALMGKLDAVAQAVGRTLDRHRQAAEPARKAVVGITARETC